MLHRYVSARHGSHSLWQSPFDSEESSPLNHRGFYNTLLRQLGSYNSSSVKPAFSFSSDNHYLGWCWPLRERDTWSSPRHHHKQPRQELRIGPAVYCFRAVYHGKIQYSAEGSTYLQDLCFNTTLLNSTRIRLNFDIPFTSAYDKSAHLTWCHHCWNRQMLRTHVKLDSHSWQVTPLQLRSRTVCWHIKSGRKYIMDKRQY